MTDRTDVPPTPVKDIPKGATFRLSRTGEDLIMGSWSYEPFELRIAVDYVNAATGRGVRMVMSAQTHGYVIAPPPTTLESLAKGQAGEAERAKDAALRGLDGLIERAQHLRTQITDGGAIATDVGLVMRALAVQRDVDAMRAATTVAEALREVLPEPPESQTIGTVPTMQPFRFVPGGKVFAIDAWYDRGPGKMEFLLVERDPTATPAGWRQVGVREFASDLPVYPVLED